MGPQTTSLKYKTFIVLSAFLYSCSSVSPKKSPSQETPPPVAAPAPEAVVVPPAASQPAEGVPAPTVETPVAPLPVLPQAFGVWIDGAGLDAMEALGILQELEAKGLKPAKVVGTGFGCWVAVSWALENRGNRAEWQAFKWNNWSHVSRSSLLDRFNLSRARHAFEDDVKRWLPALRFENLALPSDCPVVRRDNGSRFVTGHDWELPSLLWHQFQIPSLEADVSKVEVWSGLVAGLPTPQELDEFSAEIATDKVDFRGWLVIKTRGSMDRAGPDEWSGVLARRGDLHSLQGTRTPLGRKIKIVDLAALENRQGSDLRNFDRRREWLLKGRRVGARLASDFQETFAPDQR